MRLTPSEHVFNIINQTQQVITQITDIMRPIELLQRINFTKMMRCSHVARVVILASLTLGFCPLPSANASESGLETVNLQLKWRHALQFAGYYAAKEKGFYRDAGLDVNLLEHQGSQSPIDVQLSGEAQYAVSDSSIVFTVRRHYLASLMSGQLPGCRPPEPHRRWIEMIPDRATSPRYAGDFFAESFNSQRTTQGHL
jgi:hypothetical protein